MTFFPSASCDLASSVKKRSREGHLTRSPFNRPIPSHWSLFSKKLLYFYFHCFRKTKCWQRYVSLICFHIFTLKKKKSETLNISNAFTQLLTRSRYLQDHILMLNSKLDFVFLKMHTPRYAVNNHNPLLWQLNVRCALTVHWYNEPDFKGMKYNWSIPF